MERDLLTRGKHLLSRSDGHLQVVRGAGSHHARRTSTRGGRGGSLRGLRLARLCLGTHGFSGLGGGAHGHRLTRGGRRACRSGGASRSRFGGARAEALEGRTGGRRGGGDGGVLLVINHANDARHACNQQKNDSEQGNNRHDATAAINFRRQNGTIFRHTLRIPGFNLRFTMNPSHAILGIYSL